ncbi:M48 family metallopeptidase [Amorphus coralli]|uniref:M48 family metallopeptidase n=1 Tax=Amorphus coralli TaxID=340680 RepID=UPI00036117F0|nr:SprT family zinc-dependent metalloprotease [Amorphus coralli]
MPTPPLTAIALDLDGRAITVAVRRSRRARRATLRIPTGGAPIVTAPVAMADAVIDGFVRGHTGWLADKLARQAPAVAFADGAVFPLRGEDHRIRHYPGRRGTVWLDVVEGERLFCVAGQERHLARRVSDGLKRMAREDLEEASVRHAATVGRKITSVRVRDTRSQWGSCTRTGALSYSWRLILAPAFVLDYVAAHEVAHLVEHNHSDRFWRLTEELAPRTPEARRWLKLHGPGLFAIGVSDTG